MNEIKYFHETEIKCSAELVDWAKLNQLNDKSDDFFKYLGNYMEDEGTDTYALFGDGVKRYCVKIK